MQDFKFSTESKVKAAAAMIRTLYLTAGCSVEELKGLLGPEIIDIVVKQCEKEKQCTKKQ